MGFDVSDLSRRLGIALSGDVVRIMSKQTFILNMHIKEYNLHDMYEFIGMMCIYRPIQ